MAKYNWERRDILSLGSKVRFDTNNPQMGGNGSDVYDVYGVTEENNQCVVGLSEGGRFSVYNDRDIEIIGGNKDSSEGVDIIIAGTSGSIEITAMRNGAVKIKGKNIVIEADEDVDIKAGRNINLDSKQRVLLKGSRCDAKGLLGNLIPDKNKFGPQVFDGSFVGFDFLLGKGMIPGGLPDVLGTAADIAMGALDGAASGGIGGIVQGAADLATSNLTKDLPIGEIANVAIHAMQNPASSSISLANVITDTGGQIGFGNIGNELSNTFKEEAKILADESDEITSNLVGDASKILNDTFELF